MTLRLLSISFGTLLAILSCISAEELDANAQFFKLQAVEGEAHPLLTTATHWAYDDGVGFDSMHHTRFRSFRNAKSSYWKHKVPAPDLQDPVRLAQLVEVVTEKRHTPYQAWKHFIHIDNWIDTYSIDTKSGRMFFKTFIKVGENSWYHASKRLNTDREENLYDFDRNPFENKTGQVLRIRLKEEIFKKEAEKKEVIRGEFTTSHQVGEEYDIWVVTIKNGPYPNYLYRIKWHNGPDIFSPTNYHLHGGWKATLNPPSPAPQQNQAR